MRFFITFSYDGSRYNGYQKQPKLRTIQGEIERALKKINGGKAVVVNSSGRTDAGVHAINQKAHFDFDKDIPCNKIQQGLNSIIPNDIYIKKIQQVDNSFHARFDVKAKEYIYKINMGEYNPIEREYIYQYNKKLDIPEMERALKYLEGTHNFKSFVKVNNDDETYDETYIRTIVQTSLIRDIKNVNQITISILGTGFLRYMVRNIVGMLIEIGEGKYKSDEIIHILEEKNRTKAGICAPSCGLYLNDVYY